MKLSHLLFRADVESSFEDVEISFVTDKPDKCAENCAFVCVRGQNYDGHNSAFIALEKGAAVIITEKDLGTEKQIIVQNTRKAYALMCSRFFGEPSKQLKVIGVTGTNGKTTVTNMIYGLLTLMGEKAGLMGTVENIIGGEIEESSFTTPGAYEFNENLRKIVQSGAKYCVCEVSSQALDQYRTYGCDFYIGVVTNITSEHLDYHKTFKNYSEAKKKLFLQCKNAIINLDDNNAGDIIKDITCEKMTFSVRKDEADLTAKNIVYHPDYAEYTAVTYLNIGKVKIRGIGEYSVSNSLAALAVMTKLGFDFSKVCDKMKLLGTVRGRGEKLETKTPYSVFIDYAHTPDALYNVLSALSKSKEGNLIVLFGCGGDRDKEKRSVMGNIVSSLADIAVVTDDNPRNENEDEIISDILAGMNNPRCRIYVEKNRTEAIKLALDHAGKGDTVLLAGKGHEAYQIIKNKKIPFDEREKVFRFLG